MRSRRCGRRPRPAAAPTAGPADQHLRDGRCTTRDLRRRQPDWSPRDLPAADVDRLWSQLSRGASFFGGASRCRRSCAAPTPVPRRPCARGADPVTVTGDVVELILFLFGRSAVRDLAFDGPGRVAELRSADLAVRWSRLPRSGALTAPTSHLVSGDPMRLALSCPPSPSSAGSSSPCSPSRGPPGTDVHPADQAQETLAVANEMPPAACTSTTQWTPGTTG